MSFLKNPWVIAKIVYPVEVPVDDNSSKTLEFWDELNEQLFHQVQKSFAKRRIVEASSRWPETNFMQVIQDEHRHILDPTWQWKWNTIYSGIPLTGVNRGIFVQLLSHRV